MRGDGGKNRGDCWNSGNTNQIVEVNCMLFFFQICMRCVLQQIQ